MTQSSDWVTPLQENRVLRYCCSNESANTSGAINNIISVLIKFLISCDTYVKDKNTIAVT